MQASVENIYSKFTSIVAQGRDLEVSYVDEIAQGRVWAGSDALEIGLVDSIGGIEDAVIYAIAAAGGDIDLSQWQIAEFPKPLTTLEMIMETIGGSKASIFKGTQFERIEKIFKGWDESQSGQIYARIPYEIEIR